MPEVFWQTHLPQSSPGDSSRRGLSGGGGRMRGGSRGGHRCCLASCVEGGGCKVQEKENKFGILICLGTENYSLSIDFGCIRAYGLAWQEIWGGCY